MKNRIKSFYTNHRDALEVTTVVAALMGVSFALGYTVSSDKDHIAGVTDYLDGDNRQHVVVFEKNGRSKCFTNPNT